jgi:hypothetical protein
VSSKSGRIDAGRLELEAGAQIDDVRDQELYVLGLHGLAA